MNENSLKLTAAFFKDFQQEFQQTDNKVTLDQDKYTVTIVERFCSHGGKPSKTRAEVILILEKAKHDDVLVAVNFYRLVSLPYAAKQTRPEKLHSSCLINFP